MVTNNDESQTIAMPADYDWIAERRAFDDTKAGVKGLVDAGVTKVPRMFVDHQLKLVNQNSCPKNSQFGVPVVDFKGIEIDTTMRGQIIDKVKNACENWGFFQVINHGVPVRVLDEMLEGVRRFNEQDTEVKKQYYSRDTTRPFYFNSNFSLYSRPAANWRDTTECTMAPSPPDPKELPVVCRDIMIEYTSYVKKLGNTLLELFSEALGLKPNHLKEMDCAKGLMLMGNYYPICPEPELTLGVSIHSDIGFLTVLLQDQLGGLQVLNENQWVNIPPLPGALIVNVADLLQLISNDKFTSARHRVLANNKSTQRVSVASFFRMHFQEASASRLYGPIKELLSEENPPHYKETTIREFLKHRYQTGLDGKPSLSYLRI